MQSFGPRVLVLFEAKYVKKLEKVFAKLDESGEGLITEAQLNQMLPGILLEEMVHQVSHVLHFTIVIYLDKCHCGLDQ